MTYEHGTAEISYNGEPPAKANAMSPDFTGRTFTIAFGADGDVVDLTAPGVREATLVDMRKGVAEIYRHFPRVSLRSARRPRSR